MPRIFIRISALAIVFLLTASFAFTQIELRTGLVITKSETIEKKIYKLAAPASPDSAVITVRGDNITLDFDGATIEGLEPDADPDLASGIGIRIDGGKNIRILHAHIRGYRFGILARNTRGLELTDNDVSNSWKPRLFSEIEHESLVDWLSFHRNDNDEWLRYGAGIYLAHVSGGEISGNTGDDGMNGLLVTRCDHLSISNNFFSYNSGLGIGLYRSSNNRIVLNQLNFNVRGYSHGIYARGQDSADLLMYEQSDSNVVAYNSATHGGDGLFLWAGQTTMDSGKGGANDNLFYENNFSFAPANGIEATFSRNTFIGNTVEGNNYGMWGGFSFESQVVGNEFTHNRTGIAIEHGQDNIISSNLFDDDTTAIYLWANPIGASDWGYPKYRDTRSRNYRIERNVIAHALKGVKALNTDTLVLANNSWTAVDTLTILRDTSRFYSENNTVADTKKASLPPLPLEYAALAPKTSADEENKRFPNHVRAGRWAIVVDEWGPYDWNSPKLMPVRSSTALQLVTLGPNGTWKLVTERGIEKLSKESGRMRDTISVTPLQDAGGDWELTLECKDVAGERRKFSYSRFDPVIDWDLKFFSWNDSTTDPQTKPEAFAALLQSKPVVALHTPRLDYEWYRPTIKDLPAEHYAAEASGTLTLASGTYTMRTISDDAIRVWVDGAPVIDDWKPHESQLDYAPLNGGTHNLRVQYYQVDGYTEFRLDILKGINRSSGSPAPHGN